MKYKLMCLTFLFVMLLISIKPNANNSGIETESYPEEKKSNLINRLNICVLEEEPDRRPIDCFAMNKNGVIALGCSRGSSKKSICFYTQEGIFIYGVLFVCQGSFCIELNGDLLIIYFVRDNVAVSVNPNGEVVDIVAIKKTVENNKYKNRLLGQSKFKEGNTEVILKNDMGFFNLFAWNYSQLIIKSNEGEQILYDVNSSQFKKIVIMFIFILLFIALSIVYLILLFTNMNHKKARFQKVNSPPES